MAYHIIQKKIGKKLISKTWYMNKTTQIHQNQNMFCIKTHIKCQTILKGVILMGGAQINRYKGKTGGLIQAKSLNRLIYKEPTNNTINWPSNTTFYADTC